MGTDAKSKSRPQLTQSPSRGREDEKLPGRFVCRRRGCDHEGAEVLSRKSRDIRAEIGLEKLEKLRSS
jgi:hypothetical protein